MTEIKHKYYFVKSVKLIFMSEYMIFKKGYLQMFYYIQIYWDLNILIKCLGAYDLISPLPLFFDVSF